MRTGKFYQRQVEYVFALIQRKYKETLDLDKYLAICEQTGEEPDIDKMPPEMGDFPFEVQQAFLIHSVLIDQWDGMSGMYMGKDMSPLGTLLDVYEVEDKRTVVYFLSYIIQTNSSNINEKTAERQKTAQRQAKIKR